jgi:hypothetical protein
VGTTSGDAVKARDIASRQWVSTAYVEGERLGVFAHGRGEIIGSEHPDREWIERHLTDHYGASPATWGPAIVFARVQPDWMVAYAPDPSALPGIAEGRGP